jgi:hypothetical protein
MSSYPGPLCCLTNPEVVNDGTLMLRANPGPRSVDTWDSVQHAFQSAHKFWIEGSGPSEDSLITALSHRFASGVSLIELESALIGHEIDDAVSKAEAFIRNLIDKIKNAADWETLNKLAEPILGAESWLAGLLYGVCESLVGDVVNLLGLGKMIVLAGIYESIQHPVVTLSLGPYFIALAVTVRVVPWLYTEARKCNEQLRKILHELWGIAKHPIDFIESAGKHIWNGVKEDWNKLKAYAEEGTVTGDFQMGRLLGRALYQIVMMILLVLSVAGVIVKLAAKFPWLVRLVRFIKAGGELAEVGDAGEVAKAGEGLSDAAKGSEAAKPKPPSTEPSEPGSQKPSPADKPDPMAARNARLQELAKDPAQGGKITPKTLQEAKVGLACEENGKIPGPITRDPSGAAEFIDGNGTPWDVKGFNSQFPPEKGGFDVATDLARVQGEVQSGENVIVDTTKMTPADVTSLQSAVDSAGLGKNVVWYP